MAMIDVRPLEEQLPFGARIRGVTWESLDDPEVRQQINDVFEDRGVVVFEDIESSARMQVKVSEVIGPLKDHPVKIVERLDNDAMPGVIAIRNDPAGSIVEIDGKALATWQPWHFDHTYNNELNRAGVLRAATIAPEGGMTAFADGIQIYNDMDSALRAKAEQVEMIYTLDMHYERQPFGLPANFREIQTKNNAILEIAKTFPRAIHPAVWTRDTGEKVLHMCPYGTRGMVGNETPEGIALLAEIWDEVVRTIKPYYHQWKPTDMLLWDNWRMLHEACGCDPQHDRLMYRTTIKGDYGFGRWETEPRSADAVPAMG